MWHVSRDEGMRQSGRETQTQLKSDRSILLGGVRPCDLTAYWLRKPRKLASGSKPEDRFRSYNPRPNEKEKSRSLTRLEAESLQNGSSLV